MVVENCAWRLWFFRKFAIVWQALQSFILIIWLIKLVNLAGWILGYFSSCGLAWSIMSRSTLHLIEMFVFILSYRVNVRSSQSRESAVTRIQIQVLTAGSQKVYHWALPLSQSQIGSYLGGIRNSKLIICIFSTSAPGHSNQRTS